MRNGPHENQTGGWEEGCGHFVESSQNYSFKQFADRTKEANRREVPSFGREIR
jgi:hypothetical protein